MLGHPFLDRLDAHVRDRIPQQPVELRGEWTTSTRRVRRGAAAEGEAEPLVDVVDVFWRGTATSESAMSGIAFLLNAGEISWIKASLISPTLDIEVSLHAYADRKPDKATFTARLGGGFLPGVPVEGAGDLLSACTLVSDPVTTGRLVRLARVKSAAVCVLLIPGTALKMGRKRLWHVRDEVVSSLPEDLGALLTRRRTGSIRNGEAGP